MTIIDGLSLEELRAAAEKATPGPWHVTIDDDGNPLSGRPSIQAADEELDCTIVHWDGFVQEYWRSARGDKEIHANATFIAACNPRRALAFIGRVEELERLLRDETAIVDRIWDIYGRPSFEALAGRSIYDLINADRARAEKAEAEAGALRAALTAVLADIAEYERVNNLAPSPGKKDCWQSVTAARSALAGEKTE